MVEVIAGQRDLSSEPARLAWPPLLVLAASRFPAAARQLFISTSLGAGGAAGGQEGARALSPVCRVQSPGWPGSGH